MPLPGLMPTSSSWLHFCGGPSSEPSIGYTGPLDTLHVTACALFTTNRLVRLAHFLSCKSVRSRAPPRRDTLRDVRDPFAIGGLSRHKADIVKSTRGSRRK
jgi:hypothetical protein